MKSHEDYLINNFNLPSELYAINAETSKVSINYSNIKRTTKDGETALSYNGNVFYTVTADDLTGSGTQVDPYVVHSINGFLYLLKYSLSRISLSDKYFELACDMVLNDETFDENGNPSGGDGIYYNWQGNTGFTYIGYFNGNGYTIYGLYGKEEDESLTSVFTKSIFGTSSVSGIKNIKIRNTYLNGLNSARTCALSPYVGIMKNCSFDGTVISHGSIMGALTSCINQYAENCVNYGNVYQYDNQSVAGLFGQSYGDIINCDNYGNILSTGYSNGFSRAAGIVSEMLSTKTAITHCNNYGKIIGKTSNAGIVSRAKGSVVNCKNFGTIEAGTYSAGIVGQGSLSDGEYLVLENCANYGKIINVGSINLGEIIYNVGGGEQFSMKNCYAKSQSGFPLFAQSTTKENHINKCKIDYECLSLPTSYLLFINYYTDVKMEISNIEINVQKNVGKKYLFMRQKVSLNNVFIRNLIINSQNLSTPISLVNGIGSEKLDIQNSIFKTKGEKTYFGTNFSGFYVSWKTGKVGLVALDGRGTFQSALDEEWLVKKGFTKKTA